MKHHYQAQRHIQSAMMGDTPVKTVQNRQYIDNVSDYDSELHRISKSVCHKLDLGPIRLYPMREEQKKVIQKEMDRLKHLGIIQKGLTGYSSLVVLVKWKNQNLYQVCSDFRILNEKLVKINHAFPLVRDCIEQLGRKKCHYLSTIDLRDAFHTLRLVLSSQKYCGITPYYGSPTYHYLCMGMGMSVSPNIWQQFVDLVF